MSGKSARDKFDSCNRFNRLPGWGIKFIVRAKPRRGGEGSPRNLIRSAEKIVLLRWQSPGEDSDNRTRTLLVALALPSSPPRTHLSCPRRLLWERNATGIPIPFLGCNRPRTTTTGICHCLESTEMIRQPPLPSSSVFPREMKETVLFRYRSPIDFLLAPEITFSFDYSQ